MWQRLWSPVKTVPWGRGSWVAGACTAPAHISNPARHRLSLRTPRVRGIVKQRIRERAVEKSWIGRNFKLVTRTSLSTGQYKHFGIILCSNTISLMPALTWFHLLSGSAHCTSPVFLLPSVCADWIFLARKSQKPVTANDFQRCCYGILLAFNMRLLFALLGSCTFRYFSILVVNRCSAVSAAIL